MAYWKDSDVRLWSIVSIFSHFWFFQLACKHSDIANFDNRIFGHDEG